MGRRHQIAKEISFIVPTYLRHVLPHVLKTIDLPPSQIIALVTLQDKGRCRLSDLSKEMHVSAPTITGIIDRMEKSGYVRRSADRKDRRATNVTLTKKGEVAAQRFRNSIRIKWEAILEHLPTGDQETWLRIFRNITQGLAQNAH